MINDDQRRSMLYAITHHDTSRPLKLYKEIFRLEGLLHKKNEEIKSLERQLYFYKKYATKKAIKTNDTPFIYNIVDEKCEILDIVDVCRFNLKLIDDGIDLEKYLTDRISNSIKTFLKNTENRKKIQELMKQ